MMDIFNTRMRPDNKITFDNNNSDFSKIKFQITKMHFNKI